MAQRRMVSQRICNSSRFLQMPVEAQLLYFHMIVRADDDGVVELFPIIQLLGTPPDAVKILLVKEFIIQLNEDQVMLITDWLEHNTIRADRKVDSIYKHLIPENVKIIEPKPRKDVKDNSRRLGQKTLKAVRGQSTVSISKDKLSKDNIIYTKREKELKKSVKYLSHPPQWDIDEFVKKFNVTEKQVLDKADDLKAYCESHGKRYKDYKAFLRNALKKDYGLRENKNVITKNGTKYLVIKKGNKTFYFNGKSFRDYDFKILDVKITPAQLKKLQDKYKQVC